jgi:hypothetical protein
MEGEGVIGHWCSGDLVKSVPGTVEDLREITEPRTSATYVPLPHAAPQVAPRKEKSWLTKLQEEEPFMFWDQFKAQSETDMMIHVVTIGGARANPGNARWGALIRQNKKCMWFWGHYEHATNNAMELRAVIEALSLLPEGMVVWISTDSAYVKKGITEWMGSWIHHLGPECQ